MLFTDKKPVKVAAGEFKYIAGELAVGAKDELASYVKTEVYAYGVGRWGTWDKEKKHFGNPTRNALIEQKLYLSNYTDLCAILVSDTTGELSVERVFSLLVRDPETFAKCAEAALKLNPSLAPDYQVVQKEATNDKGELKSQEELAEKN